MIAESLSLYEAFNYLECGAWMIVAVGLPVWFRKCPQEKRPIIYRASVAFILFGVSDYLEAPTNGQLPPWLWAWKIGCGLYFLRCRYLFIGKDRFRWLDRTHILAALCLAAVILAMVLQFLRAREG